jgi:hypothetical protein
MTYGQLESVVGFLTVLSLLGWSKAFRAAQPLYRVMSKNDNKKTKKEKQHRTQ